MSHVSMSNLTFLGCCPGDLLEQFVLLKLSLDVPRSHSSVAINITSQVSCGRLKILLLFKWLNHAQDLCIDEDHILARLLSKRHGTFKIIMKRTLRAVIVHTAII